MRNRFFALGLALLFTLAPVAPALAKAPAPADWSAVRSLTPGEKVSVRTKDGDRLKGRFESATETDITEGGRKVSLRRDSVARVEVGHTNRLTGALVGAGVGGGVGTGAGAYLLSRTDHLTMSAIPAGGVLGAGVGAAVGAAFGLGTDYDTIYQAQ
jgi:hypothetical protein